MSPCSQVSMGIHFPMLPVRAYSSNPTLLLPGDFDTGIYPDEWHWRQGISLPGAVREICNGWKSDQCIRATVLDKRFGRIACELMQWQSASAKVKYARSRNIIFCMLTVSDLPGACSSRLAHMEATWRWSRLLSSRRPLHQRAVCAFPRQQHNNLVCTRRCRRRNRRG